MKNLPRAIKYEVTDNSVVVITNVKKVLNPNTVDNISKYVVMTILVLFALSGFMNVKKKLS